MSAHWVHARLGPRPIRARDRALKLCPRRRVERGARRHSRSDALDGTLDRAVWLLVGTSATTVGPHQSLSRFDLGVVTYERKWNFGLDAGLVPLQKGSIERFFCGPDRATEARPCPAAVRPAISPKKCQLTMEKFEIT